MVCATAIVYRVPCLKTSGELNAHGRYHEDQNSFRELGVQQRQALESQALLAAQDMLHNWKTTLGQICLLW